MRTLSLFLASTLLSACTTIPAVADDDGLTWAKLGQTVSVDGPQITPLRVLEDSRCPMEARCVWAGRLRLEVRAGSGPSARQLELTMGEPADYADGKLELVSTMPPQSTQHPPASGDLRFGFRFQGGY